MPRICRQRPALVLAALLAAVVSPAAGQLAVTSIVTSTSDLSNQEVNDVTFQRTTISVTQLFDAAGNYYTANTVAGAAFVRRNTTAGNANNSSVWYTQAGDPEDFRAPYATDYGSLLLGNNLLRGSDNTFANGNTSSDGNIERLDFLFSPTGIVASTSTSFAVFDRGAINQHDNVKIAVITGWDSATDRPTAYGGVLGEIETADYGTTNPVGNFTYNLFRYSNGDNLGSPYWNNNSSTGTQGIGGVVISMADLGIADGTIIYGYSLMGYDVTVGSGGSMANLVDWTNATYFPTNTTGATGSGGIDLSAVNGVLYNRVVPEPSTYGAILLGLGLGGLGFRRWWASRRRTA